MNRDIAYGLVYQGDVTYVDYCLDSGEAVSRYEGINSLIFCDFEIKVYGKNRKFSLPMMKGDISELHYMQDDFIDFLINATNERLLPDKVFGIRQVVLKKYECVSYKGIIFFIEKNGVVNNLENRSNEDKGISVAQREMLLGYVRAKPYILRNNNGEKEMKLHTIIKSKDGSIEIPYNYTVGLRNAMFGEEKKRRVMKALLQERQYKVLELQGHMTYVAAGRRSGKSFLAAFVAIREIMKNSFSMANSFRPVNVIYIGLKQSSNLKVVNYMKSMAKTFMKGSSKGSAPTLFHWDSARNIFSFRSGKEILGEVTFLSQEMNDPGIGEYADMIIIDEAGKIRKDIFDGVLPIVLAEKAKLFCISTMYKDSLKGWFFERLLNAETVSDEDNARLTQEYRSQVEGLKLCLEEGEGLEEISNPIYQKVLEDQGKYNNIVRSFMDDMPSVGFRFTIEDIEHMTDRDKENMRNDENYKNDDLRYMTELYSRFPDEGRVLDYEKVLVKPEKVYGIHYDSITIGYDTAIKQDKPGLVAIGRHSGIGKFGVLYAGYISGFQSAKDHYGPIIELMSDMKKYLIDGGQIYFVMDATQSGAVDALQLQGLEIDLRVVYTGGQVVSQSTHFRNEVKIPKKHLVDISSEIFNNLDIMISLDDIELMKELDAFQRIETNNGNIKYEAISGNDDIVNAMMIALYHQYEHMKNKYVLYSSVNNNARNIRSLYREGGGEVQKAEEEMRKAKENYLKVSNKFFSTFSY